MKVYSRLQQIRFLPRRDLKQVSSKPHLSVSHCLPVSAYPLGQSKHSVSSLLTSWSEHSLFDPLQQTLITGSQICPWLQSSDRRQRKTLPDVSRLGTLFNPTVHWIFLQRLSANMYPLGQLHIPLMHSNPATSNSYVFGRSSGSNTFPTHCSVV